MAYQTEFKWKNSESPSSLNFEMTFIPSRVTVYDNTVGAIYVWDRGMPGEAFMQIAGSGTSWTTGLQTTNGFTPMSSQTALYGAPLTEIQLPVIDILYGPLFGFSPGDTVMIVQCVAPPLGSSTFKPNGLPLTVQSVNFSGSSGSVTVTPSSPPANYVNAGMLLRVKDSQGNPLPIKNYAFNGGTLGTGMVGAANSDMLAIFEGPKF